ncbi:MAG TPA: accessory gene regulator B family protein [Clostridia bacterium]
MRFIQSWSYACASYVSSQMNETHEKRRVYYYGFQVIIASLVKGFLLVAFAALTGSFAATISVMLSFASLRVIAGGYHMNTYGKCATMSIGLFVISGCIAQYTYHLWNLWSLIVLVIFSLMVSSILLFKWAPRDTPGRPITDPGEIKKFRFFSAVYLLIWCALVSILTYFNYYLYSIAICFGLLMEAFIITPAAFSLLDKISEKMESK